MKSVGKLLAALLIITLLAVLPFFRTDISFESMKLKYADASSKFLDVDGMPLHYRIDGNGPPLLLIHGTSSSLFTWDGWTEELKDSFTVVRVDLPGFGLTGPHPERDYSIEMYTSTLKQLIDYLDLDSVYVAGNSLGGYISWNMAVDYPNIVKKAILLDAVAYHQELPQDGINVKDRGHSLAFALAGNPFIATLVRWITPRFMVANSLKEVYFDESLVTEELVDLYYDMVRRAGNRQAFIDNIQTRKPEGKEALLPQLETPVLIQWGREDEWVDLSLAYWFESALPNAELIVYDEAGHVPMEEIPQATALDARLFLNGQLDAK